MAKYPPKHARAESAPVVRGYVGWRFWLITFFLLYGPAWYLGYRSIYESERDGFVPWVIALTLAAVCAGLLSLAANYVLRRRAEVAKKQARILKKK